jgi:hypothetical protein
MGRSGDIFLLPDILADKVYCMQWDINQICEVLNADVAVFKGPPADTYTLTFQDKYFKFSLHVQPENDNILIAADPTETAGMPLFEYSCNCNIIEVIDSLYIPGTKAVYFFEDKTFGDGVRLALNLRHDGNWYIWANVWKNK